MPDFRSEHLGKKMKLYYHHVGVEGSTTDFPKTVFSELPLSIVEDSIPTHIVQREDILRELAASFPTGHFNCWGVPSGARSVIKNLSPGDAVLLIATTSKNGEIPALCEVKCFWSIHLPELSNALWGEPPLSLHLLFLN
jgi:5-methylcytosine-specific restriction enzyme A